MFHYDLMLSIGSLRWMPGCLSEGSLSSCFDLSELCVADSMVGIDEAAAK